MIWVDRLGASCTLWRHIFQKNQLMHNLMIWTSFLIYLLNSTRVNLVHWILRKSESFLYCYAIVSYSGVLRVKMLNNSDFILKYKNITKAVGRYYVTRFNTFVLSFHFKCFWNCVFRFNQNIYFFILYLRLKYSANISLKISIFLNLLSSK